MLEKNVFIRQFIGDLNVAWLLSDMIKDDGFMSYTAARHQRVTGKT